MISKHKEEYEYEHICKYYRGGRDWNKQLLFMEMA